MTKRYFKKYKLKIFWKKLKINILFSLKLLSQSIHIYRYFSKEVQFSASPFLKSVPLTKKIYQLPNGFKNNIPDSKKLYGFFNQNICQY